MMEKGYPGTYQRQLLLTILLMFLHTAYAGADTGVFSATGPQSATGPLSKTGQLPSISLSSGGALYPPSYEWKCITTPHNLLIFPTERENAAEQEAAARQGAAELSAAQQAAQQAARQAAQNAAAAVTAAWGPVSRDFGIDLKPYPLVLNTSLDIANGYFGLAPRKSEWYSYPPQEQFGGGADWYSLLAFHEGRHAAQFSAMDRGFIRWAHVLAGEYGWAGLSFYAFPLWYFEGDAILSETAFTEAGRGRNAAFHREIRAIALEGEFPSYQQAYLGSFKNHFPSFYHLGYPLVTYTRMMYGGDAWNEIIRETARFAFWPLRFHRAVKKVTGRSVPELYEDSLEFLGSYWARQSGQEVQDDPQGFEYLTPETKDWTCYYPIAVDTKGDLYALVKGDRRPAEIVLMDFSRSGGSDEGGQKGTGTENGDLREVRAFPLSARDDWIDIADEKAVWAETIPHPLWTNVSSSDLIIRDLKEGDRRRLTRGKHLQAPVFSPDARRIAAIEVQPGGRSSLVIFDAEDGRQIEAADPVFDTPGPGDTIEGPYLRHPVWSGDGGRIAAVGSSNGKSGLFEYDVKEDTWRLLYGPVVENLADPCYWNEYLLYTSDYSGREAVYALDTGTGEVLQVAEGRIAAVKPLVIAGRARLLFSDYGTAGFRLAWTYLDENSFIPMEGAKRGPINYAEAIAAELNKQARRPEKMEPGLGSITTAGTEPATEPGTGPKAENQARSSGEYPVETYHPAAHLFNFHSWGLLPDGEGRVELFAQSDDPIGLLSLRTFTGINPLEESYDLGFQGTYRGAFPIIHFGLSGDVNYPGDPDLNYYGYTGLFGLEAPINLSRGIWQRELALETAAYIRGENSGPIGSGSEMDVLLPVRYSISFYNGSTAVAPADYTTPWRQYSQWSLYHVPLQEEYSGWRLEQRGDFVFPGLFRQHRLSAGIDAEWNRGEEVPLSITPIRPKGYPLDWNDEYPGDIVAGLAYTLPLVSPDMAIGNIYYLKRILLTLFTDVGIGGEDAAAFTQNHGLEYYPSSGIEFMGEQNFFNWPVTLQAGIRLIYRWRDETFRVEESLFTLGFEWK